MKKKTNPIIYLIATIIILIAVGIYAIEMKKEDRKQKEEPIVLLNNDFNIDIIKIINSKEDSNYLISPYSIEIALTLLKEGTAEESYNQINKVIPNRNINIFEVKDRISVANAIFIRNSEKENISKDYINKLQKSYKADLIYDKFETPDKINNWVNDKTYGMIPKILEGKMSKDFVLGLANAVAIDLEWSNQFKCIETSKEDFITSDGIQKVEMMNKNYGKVSYILNDNEKGIILPYISYKSNGEYDYSDSEDSTKFEFIAIMPTKESIKEYVNNLTNDKLNNILNSIKETKDNQELNLKLPRFEYDYDDKHFKEDLIALGISDVFNPDIANLSKMKSSNNNDQLYVNSAIHKTHISLNEKGTKAAAVTYFGIEKNTAMIEEKEQINIEFTKPFMYIIRDTKTKEMLFFGVVESPNKWNGTTCTKTN